MIYTNRPWIDQIHLESTRPAFGSTSSWWINVPRSEWDQTVNQQVGRMQQSKKFGRASAGTINSEGD